MVLLIVAGGVGGYMLAPRTTLPAEEGPHPLREGANPYRFINPLLAYEVPESRELEEYAKLKQKLNDVIAIEKTEGKAKDVSVYFRDLSQGQWVGINATTPYQPASLLKVVVMIAYLKNSEKDPALLQKKMLYPNTGLSITQAPFETPSKLRPGTRYTVDELIASMITESDNGAMNLLLQNVDDDILTEVYTDLGIQSPENGTYTISARSYSLFFRILYNATYLNRENSEKALRLLSGAEYTDGLRHGIPTDISVSHKFGESILSENKSVIEVQLHDCGIVYHPTRPYLLCVMTRGADSNALADAIARISRIIYDEVRASS